MSAYTQDDLDTIEAAIATGAKRVRFQTHEIEYASFADMMKARDFIASKIAPASQESRVSVAHFNRGFSNR